MEIAKEVEEKKSLDELALHFDNYWNVIISYMDYRGGKTYETFHFEVDYDHKNIIRSIDRENPRGSGRFKNYIRLDDEDHEFHKNMETRLCFINEDICCNNCDETIIERISILPVGCGLMGEIEKSEKNYADFNLVAYIQG
jgi:hypothetical protein